MSTINPKPDSPNNINISEDKKQIIIESPDTHKELNITTGQTINVLTATSTGPQGQIGPEGPIGNVGESDSLNLLHITASGNISGSSTSTIEVGGDITSGDEVFATGDFRTSTSAKGIRNTGEYVSLTSTRGFHYNKYGTGNLITLDANSNPSVMNIGTSANNINLKVVGNISGSATSTGSFGSLISRTTYIGEYTPIFNEGANMLIIDSSDAQMLSLRRNNENIQWNLGLSTAGDLTFRERTTDAGGGNNRVFFLKDGGASFGSHITASGNLWVGSGSSANINVEGNISGSSTSTGSFGDLSIDDLGTFSRIGVGITNPSYDVHLDNKRFVVDYTGIGFGHRDNSNNQFRIFTNISSGHGELYVRENNDSNRVILKGNEASEFVYGISGSSISTGSLGAGYFDGRVGIGKTSPTSLLHLKQSGISADTNTDILKVEGNYLLGILGAHDSLYNSGKLELYKDGSDVNVSLNAGGTGNYPSWFKGPLGVGITGSLGAKLHVVGDVWVSGSNGHITASGNISASGAVYGSTFYDLGVEFGADYVFEPEYILRTLPEVEEHIEEHQHLPGLPPADDINGWKQLSIGDRDMKLLEKVEELTLYVIDLQKQIDELKNK